MAEADPPIKRILVALDASPGSRFSIRAAVDLAARFGAELIGLFVEDINLLRVARLPFAREVSSFSLTLRSLDPEDMKRQLQAQAQTLRRSLAVAAELHRVHWQFRVAHGPVALEVMRAGADADLMIMGRTGGSFGGRRLGSTVRTMVLGRPGMTFIAASGLHVASPVTVLFDGSTAGLKALEIAAPLSVANDRHLTVVVVSGSRGEAGDLSDEARRRLAGRPLQLEFRIRVQPSYKGLAWLVRMAGAGPVVFPCGSEILEGEPLCALVDEIPNPVLLVR